MSLQHSKRKVAKGLSELFEIPQDIMMDLPRLTVLGNVQLLVENHKGIVEYTPEQVRIRINRGELVINGDKLTLHTIQIDQMLIEGSIGTIRFEQ